MKKYENYTKAQLIQKIKQLESKKYGLVWDDEKEPEKVVIECQNSIPILKKINEKTIKTDIQKPTNILIEGDNYHALQVLNYTHKGQIDVIYIDPPYNTGNKDFKYNDSFVDKEDGYRHSKWLNFMSKRLKLAHNLLKDSGVIFISIDDNEVAQLKLLCDDIFKNSFLSQLVWKKKAGGGSDAKYFASDHEYILIYAKNENSVDKFFTKISDKQKKEYKFKDNNFAKYGFYKRKNLYQTGIDDNRPNLRYEIMAPDGTKILPPTIWRWSKETFEKEQLKGKIDIVLDSKKKWQVYTKNYLYEEDNNERQIKPRSLLLEQGLTRDGNNDLKNIFGISIFSYPKPVKLVKYLLEIISKENSIILDFFAGSGTTGHAVLELNKEDEGNRQFILCTNNENSICEEVTYPRISKVINGYTTPKGVDIDGISGNLDYYKTDLIPTNGISNITDTTREELTKKAGNMIAIKENTHYMLELCEHYQIFINETTKKQTAIYFTEDLSCFDELIEKTKSHSTKLYIFSFGKIDKSSYKYLGKNYQIEDIPEPIIEIYKEINKEGIL
ncbi:site-specific DNA-methyltransferase [Malaciobacter pacificus]|uniref:site-specific DNA-methyltransferase (adenine-specific) n=1 Tax=Malaciobacter pacificus TaxID=1080223 RepID=A0A5C2H4Y5_9BACT|nr:site-specific DNA-methyltransferase [Malaciobacter pacificus]QEP34060.1 type III restriction/modification system, modification subunit [Malaciobacter pacificus]GGD40110.1 site-specific DNA-methyltransferase [Malaciobacter pacificus]